MKGVQPKIVQYYTGRPGYECMKSAQGGGGGGEGPDGPSLCQSLAYIPYYIVMFLNHCIVSSRDDYFVEYFSG